ncbi:C40 family peptidase [Brevibacillus sp. NRS-1366]|uniref:C40 family peptidase n=1 Tax=Brevibacillus sp. NRS-1366 TaxID=3233899 RepID=UPI003D201AEE
MIRRNWKGKTCTVLAILMGTSLLMGGQAYAATEKSHKSTTHHKQHQKHIKHTQVKKSYQQTEQQAKQQTDNQADKQSNVWQNNDEQSVDNTPKEENTVTPDLTNDLAQVNPDSGLSTSADNLNGSFAATSAAKNASVSSNVANQIISNGLKYKGRPYKFGSSKNTTSTFDCSSFTQRVFKEAGITLPRDSRQQSKVGQQVSKNQLQKGDLIFFRSYGSSSSRITHVAIYAGNNTLLHTYGSPGVTTSKFLGTSWEKRFEIARRVTA